MRLPDSNLGSAIGAVVLAVAVALLEALNSFFQSGQAWPSDLNGWGHLLIPALVAGLLGALTPRFSTHEAAHGYRKARKGDAALLHHEDEKMFVKRG